MEGLSQWLAKAQPEPRMLSVLSHAALGPVFGVGWGGWHTCGLTQIRSADSTSLQEGGDLAIRFQQET